MELTDTAEVVLKKRYYLPEEKKWEHLCGRVSNFFGKTEDEKKSFFNIMFDGDFLPNSPTLMNAGTSINSFSACFVLPIEDSIDSIYKFYSDAAKISKSGGGVGSNYSKIRAKNASVNSTKGVASGPLSFMEVQDTSTNTIKQGGRRKGANMGILDASHADILDFIRYKEQKDKLTNYNLSVLLSDDFMSKIDEEGKEKELWGLLCQKAWKSAEPGVLFGDTAERANTVPHLGRLKTTNPCQPSYSTVLTPQGISTIGKIKIGDTIWSGKQWTKVINKVATGVKDVSEYRTTTGKFIGTENHRIVQNGEKIEVKDADSIDWNVGDKSLLTKDFDPQAIMDGLVIGDGSVHKASDNLVFLCIGERDSDYFDSEIKNLITRDRRVAFKTGWEIKTTIHENELPKTFNRKVPDRFYFGNEKIKRSFLRGLFTANGSIAGTRVTLKQSSKELIEQVQEMLSSLGIHSYITINKGKLIEFSNGEYQCKNSYDLNITSGRSIFRDHIGFIQKYKQEAIIDGSAQKYFTSNIKEIIYKGKEEVFDITVEADEHTYWTGGCLVSNCGEQWLLFYESCSLGSINVGNFIKNGEVDWYRFEKAIKIAVLFKNRVLDMTQMPIPECQEALEKTRKIGIGLMGLHDLLIQIGLCYDSEEGRSFSGSVMKFIAEKSNEMSVELGEKEGVYKGWIEGCPKRRNANLTTIAPTGTLSMICDCSSGVEPYYSVITIKHVLDGEKLVLVNKWFEKKLLESFTPEETSTIIGKVKEAGTINIPEVPDNLKNLFKGANDISPENHILMQAEMQKYVDSSISKTINMPSSATVEDVDRVYRMAWKLGCKGVTVYRDGSRDEQVLYNSAAKTKMNEERPDGIKFNLSPKRPKELEADIHHCTIKGVPWVVAVGLFNNMPYELFAGELNDLYIPKTCKGGVITKEKNGLYSLTIQIRNSKVKFDDIAHTLMDSDQRALTRMVSLALRHGVHYEFIVKQLKKSSGDITDFAAVVNRVLKTYIKQYLYEHEKPCPECGGKLIKVEGCEKCSSCGISKCG